jgi:hypothetical protein
MGQAEPRRELIRMNEPVNEVLQETKRGLRTETLQWEIEPLQKCVR